MMIYVGVWVESPLFETFVFFFITEIGLCFMCLTLMGVVNRVQHRRNPIHLSFKLQTQAISIVCLWVMYKKNHFSIYLMGLWALKFNECGLLWNRGVEMAWNTHTFVSRLGLWRQTEACRWEYVGWYPVWRATDPMIYAWLVLFGTRVASRHYSDQIPNTEFVEH